MTQPRRKRPSPILPVLRLAGSAILIAVLLYMGSLAIRFCLGMFVTGDKYILDVPGQTVTLATEPEDESDSTAPTESGAVRETGRATILTTGDLMMHMPTVRSGYSDGQYSFSYIFSYIKDYISAADYAVVNLETTLSGTDKKEYTGYPKFNSPDAVASGAAGAGFDLMLTGNNHCYDYGTAGLLRTLDVIRAAGMDTLGTYSSKDDPQYLVRELGGIKFGMLNYTFAKIGSDPDLPTVGGLAANVDAAGLINAFDYSQPELFYAEIRNQIDAMRAAGSEVIVLFIHWGDEYTTKVTDTQKEMAQKLCDLGVDIIAGSHPHVIQTMDLLTSTEDETHQTLVLYSMGNFLSNQRHDNISLTTGQSEDSLLFSFTFVRYSDGTLVLESAKIQPTWVLIRGTGDGRTYHILPLDYDAGDWTDLFDLTSSQAEDARKSYNRTMDIIGSDYKRIQSVLAQQQADRNPPEFGPGVG